VLLACFLGVALVAVWLSGPGLNVIGTRILRNQLQNLGLSGDFTVEEIDRSGVRVSNVDMSGTGMIRSMKGESLTVDYSLNELRQGQIQSLDARNFEIVLDLAATPEREDAAFDADAFGETLRSVQQQMGGVDLYGENVTLHVFRGDKALTSIEGANIRQDAGSETIHVQFSQVKSASGGTPVPRQDMEITWGPDGLRLDRFELLPGLLLEDLEVLHARDAPLRAEGVLRVGDAMLLVSLDENFSLARLTLEKGPLDLATLTRLVDQETPFGGTVGALNLTLRNTMSAPGLWSASGNVTAARISYLEWRLDDVLLKFGKEEALADFELTGNFHGSRVAVSAGARFQPEVAADAERWWHGANFSGGVETGNLEPALVELRRQRNPESTGIPAPQGRLEMKFSADLEAGDLARASADYQLRDLAAEGETLPPIEGRALWEPGSRRFTATIRHDDSLAVTGWWNPKEERYEAAADLENYNLSALAAFLQPLGFEMPSGSATGSWSGRGVLAAKSRHSGAILLEDSFLNFPEHPALIATLRGNYEWPGELRVDLLQLAHDSRMLEASGNWAGGRVTIPELTVTDEAEVLFNGQADFPLAPELRTLDEFFSQTGPVSATLEASDLALSELRELLPGVDFPIDGNISGTLEISGSVSAPVAETSFGLRDLTAKALPDLAPTDVLVVLRSAEGRIDVEGRFAQDGESVMDLVATLPLSPRVRSTEDFLAQEEGISIRVETSDFPVEQLQQFLPSDFAELPDAGKIDGVVTVVGTFGKPEVRTKITVRGISRAR
jgi:hypothetical protein